MFDKTPPKGMRDILPEDLLLREKISDTIKGVYRSYGFTGIETPCVEDLGLLTSKQGGDNEKLISKFSNAAKSWKTHPPTICATWACVTI